jgi:hypothetical protein
MRTERTRSPQDVRAQILEQAEELERLTKDTPAWYAGTRAAPEQAEELRRVVGDFEREWIDGE